MDDGLTKDISTIETGEVVGEAKMEEVVGEAEMEEVVNKCEVEGTVVVENSMEEVEDETEEDLLKEGCSVDVVIENGDVVMIESESPNADPPSKMNTDDITNAHDEENSVIENGDVMIESESPNADPPSKMNTDDITNAHDEENSVADPPVQECRDSTSGLTDMALSKMETDEITIVDEKNSVISLIDDGVEIESVTEANAEKDVVDLSSEGVPPPEPAAKKRNREKDDEVEKSKKKKKKDKRESEEKKSKHSSKEKSRDESKSRERESNGKHHEKSRHREDDKHKEREKKKDLPLLDKYWSTVKKDPSDFTGWTYLLQYVDGENDVESACKVYDDFLANYPNCYGYWRKYAEYMRRHHSKKSCEKIYERGVKAIPLSVDLWLHYITFKKSLVPDESQLRSLYEDAVKACGMEFKSDRLWDSYVKWESEVGNLVNVTAVLDRWLAMPTQQYMDVIDRLKLHVKKNNPQDILTADDFLTMRQEVTKSSPAEDMNGVEAPPGEEGVEDLNKLTERETKAIKELIVDKRQEVYKSTTEAVLARWNYEESIKRPYFHVKPLEKCQLKNWHDYINFELKEGNQERAIFLFERCLIACALYEEYWVEYISYLREQLSNGENLIELTRDVFERACTIHHKNTLFLYLEWSTFEESQGNMDKAEEVLKKAESVLPLSLVLIQKRINLEQRRGHMSMVCELYEKYCGDDFIFDDMDIPISLRVKYSRFAHKGLKNIDKAINILKKGAAKHKGHPRLYLQLIQTCMQRPEVNVEEVTTVFDEVLSQEDMELSRKLLFTRRKAEFLEEFSTDCIAIQEAYKDYLNYLKLLQTKKRAMEPTEQKNDTNNSSSASDANTTYGPHLPTNVPTPTASTPYVNNYAPSTFQGAPYHSSTTTYAQPMYAAPEQVQYQQFPSWQYAQQYPQGQWPGQSNAYY